MSVIEPGSPLQLILATLVMLIFTLVTLKLAPYRSKADDWTSFMVSLVITGNTQAGFVLLMDKDTHNFNPDNIEVMLLVMNIGVLSMQVLNMVLIKWGCWVKLKSTPCCKKMCPVAETNLHKITPSPVVSGLDTQVQARANSAWEMTDRVKEGTERVNQ